MARATGLDWPGAPWLVDADPLSSPEHILLTNLIHHAYPGNDYDDLISAVDAAIAQRPKLEKLPPAEAAR